MVRGVRWTEREGLSTKWPLVMRINDPKYKNHLVPRVSFFFFISFYVTALRPFRSAPLLPRKKKKKKRSPLDRNSYREAEAATARHADTTTFYTSKYYVMFPSVIPEYLILHFYRPSRNTTVDYEKIELICILIRFFFLSLAKYIIGTPILPCILKT